MDCEKFETTLIDELYDELDELTSAAAKRHVAGCARCAALLGGLKATRRVAMLPIVEPSSDLEERILAAAKDAQKVVPFTRKLSEAVSWAGSWAMRPQTAMAALFLLMVGTSAVLIRVRKPAATASMTITAEGTPAASAAAPMAMTERDQRMDPSVAAAAHGAPAIPLPPPPAATAAPGASALAKLDTTDPWDDGVSGTGNKGGLSAALTPKAPQAQALYGPGYGGGGSADLNANAPSGGAPPARHSAVSSNASSHVTGELGREKSEAPSEKAGVATNPAFDAAMAEYKSGKYDDATQGFDAIRGDDTAALWAARSVRDGSGGCAQAAPRFDAIASRAFGTNAGYDATLEAGRCLQAQGSVEPARLRFARLLTVPGYATRAQAAIDALPPSQQQQYAARKAVSRPKAATVQQAPSKPAAPPAAATPPQQQQATPQAPAAF